jgi:hypothetical protein
MGPIDFLILALIAAILGFAGWYVYKSKKSGQKCIGCPDGATCGNKCSGGCAGCSCSCSSQTEE